MSEILNCIKLIKMYAWEMPFSRQIESIRRREQGILQKAGYNQVSTHFLTLQRISRLERFYSNPNLSSSNVFSSRAKSIMSALSRVLPTLGGVVTFSLIVGTGGNMDAADVFSTIALFQLIRFSLVMAPRALRVCILLVSR